MPDNKLEIIIKEHAEELFGSEPLPGHRKRFAEKLIDINAGSEQRTSFYKIISYITVAAVFAGCVFTFHRAFRSDYQLEVEPLQEVQNYYSMLLQDKIDDIEQLLFQIDELDREALKKDIIDMLEETDYAFQNSEEKNAGFIVANYSSKIEALQHIQTILENNL